MLSNRQKRNLGVRFAKSHNLDYKKVYLTVKEYSNISFNTPKDFEDKLLSKLRLGEFK